MIDTPTDLRTQLLREGIGLVHATLYTHGHADHIFGLDDLRLFPYYLGHKLPLYCELVVEERIRKSFDYAFGCVTPGYPHAAVPQLDVRRITTEPFDLLGTRVIPIRLLHGQLPVLGFRFGNVAYCTDTNQIPEESLRLLEGLDVLIVDALRRKSHPTHFNIDEALQVVSRLQPKQTLFTHMSHDLEHAATCESLPPGVSLAFDGLKVPLT